jgi:3-oxoacyl-[acyl-carrier-protein] synthase-3
VQAVVKHTRIAGICTAVPKKKVNFFESSTLFSPQEMDRVYENTGIREIRSAPPGMVVSDMCTAAAERLMERLGWERSSIELIVLITQSPDVPLPATACLMQRRLKLPNECAAFDINLGCSGYVYGLWVVSQLLTSMNKGRALLMVGDKSTEGLHPDDTGTAALFGDAGAVTAIERCADENPVYYVGGSDGEGGAHLNLKAGQNRCQIPISLKPFTKEEYDQLMLNCKLHMNGPEVFGFTLRVVPKLIRETLALAGIEKEDVQYYVFHQANKFILEHLARKMKLPEGSAVLDLELWGNTSSASVPLAICDKLVGDIKDKPAKMCLAGFGVGWSWMACVLDIGPIPVAEIYEIPDDFYCDPFPC